MTDTPTTEQFSLISDAIQQKHGVSSARVVEVENGKVSFEFFGYEQKPVRAMQAQIQKGLGKLAETKIFAAQYVQGWAGTLHPFDPEREMRRGNYSNVTAITVTVNEKDLPALMKTLGLAKEYQDIVSGKAQERAKALEAIPQQSFQTQERAEQFAQLIASLSPEDRATVRRYSLEAEKKSQQQLEGIVAGKNGVELQKAVGTLKALYGAKDLNGDGKKDIDSDRDGLADTAGQVVSAAHRLQQGRDSNEYIWNFNDVPQMDAVARLLNEKARNGDFGEELKRFEAETRGKEGEASRAGAYSEAYAMFEHSQLINSAALQDDIFHALNPPATTGKTAPTTRKR